MVTTTSSKSDGDQPVVNPAQVFEKVGHLVRRLHQISTSVFIDEAKNYNLTPVQFSVLMAVKVMPGIDQVGIGKFVALDRTTVSVVVKRLLERGLVERLKAKGRKAPLRITGTAAAVIEVMQPRLANIEEIILSPLSDGEQTTFMKLLGKLVDSNNSLSRAPYESHDVRPTPRRRQKEAAR
jgi:DNA-binding MarR family transcriptional regulator